MLFEDIGVTDDCKNEDAIHICCKCNGCGRFKDQRIPTDEEMFEIAICLEDEEDIWRREFKRSELAGQLKLAFSPLAGTATTYTGPWGRDWKCHDYATIL